MSFSERSRGGWAAGGLLLAVLSLPRAAEARSCRVQIVPNGNRFQCTTCHTGGNGGSRNLFGRAVETLINRSSSCQARFWGPELAAQDADGDGLTNGAELQDPEGLWQPGQPNPGTAAQVTNPGVKNAPPPKRYVRGDADLDGKVTISDVVNTAYLLFGGAGAPPCARAADANRDGKVDVADAVFTLHYLFTQGPAPAAPFPRCGTITSALECAAEASCAA